MSRGYKIVVVLLVLLLAFFVYAEASKPAPVDWSPTFSIKSKTPLGTYVFFHSLDSIQQVRKVNQSPYQFLEDSTLSGTYIFVNNRINFNKAARKKLFKWVAQGNTLFVSANYSNLFNLDTLSLEWTTRRQRRRLIDYPQYNLVNPQLHADSAYTFTHNSAIAFFSKIDTIQTTVLGEVRFKRDSAAAANKWVNFIRIPRGKGKIILQTAPQAFSNFFMLSAQNYEYAQKALAYLPISGPVYYDVYYDVGFKVFHGSPLYVLLSNKYLKWGYYFIIIGAILFIIFEGKRKQKAIRVVPPLRNKTYEYTRTISGMYLKKKDHTTIAHKKIEQFLAYIRNELHTDVQKINQDLVTRLQQLTANSEEDIWALLKEIQRLQSSHTITKQELVSLNKKINHFKNHL